MSMQVVAGAHVPRARSSLRAIWKCSVSTQAAVNVTQLEACSLTLTQLVELKLKLELRLGKTAGDRGLGLARLLG
jgi:hypothetical protein